MRKLSLSYQLGSDSPVIPQYSKSAGLVTISFGKMHDPATELDCLVVDFEGSGSVLFVQSQ